MSIGTARKLIRLAGELPIVDFKRVNGHTRAYVRLTLVVKGVKCITIINISDRRGRRYPMLLGLRDLRKLNLTVDLSDDVATDAHGKSRTTKRQP